MVPQREKSPKSLTVQMSQVEQRFDNNENSNADDYICSAAPAANNGDFEFSAFLENVGGIGMRVTNLNCAYVIGELFRREVGSKGPKQKWT